MTSSVELQGCWREWISSLTISSASPKGFARLKVFCSTDAVQSITFYYIEYLQYLILFYIVLSYFNLDILHCF